MPTAFHNNFNGGEISPLLDERNDIARYRSSCRRLRNALVKPFGGAFMRPPLKHLGPSDNGQCLLMPFNFSTNENLLLEWTDKKIRFWKDESLVQAQSGGNYQLVTPYAVEHLFDIQHIELNDVVYLVHPLYPVHKLTRFADNNWTLEEVEWNYPPLLEQNTSQITMRVEQGTGGAEIGLDEYKYPWVPWQVDILDNSVFSNPVSSRRLSALDDNGGSVGLPYMRATVEPSGSPLETTGEPYNWKGFLYIKEGGDWIIQTGSDDGGVVSIDGQVVTVSYSNNWNYRGLKNLTQGWHTLEVRWTNNGGTSGQIQVGFEKDGVLEYMSAVPEASNKSFDGTKWSVRATKGESAYLIASADYFYPGHIGSYFELGYILEDNTLEANMAVVGASDAIRIDGDWTFTTNGTNTYAGTIHIERAEDDGQAENELVWENLRTYKFIGNKNVADSGTESGSAKYRVRVSAYSGGSGSCTLEPKSTRQNGLVKITGLATEMNLEPIPIPDPNQPPVIPLFADGELLTGLTSGATATVIRMPGNDMVTIDIIVGTFEDGETIQGGTSLSEREYVAPLEPSKQVAKIEIITQVDDAVFYEATTKWTEGAFSGEQGYPRTVAFHEQRIWYGGTESLPSSMWASVISDIDNFKRSTLDDSSLFYTLAATESNPINWMTSISGGLAIGTRGEEWLMDSGGSDSAISPSNVRAKRQGRRGSAYIPAIVINEAAIFVSRNRLKVHEFVYNFDVDGYLAPELSQMAEHITDTGVKQMGYAGERDSILWLTTNDGRLLGLTYQREQEVVAWHQHSPAEGVFDSVAVLRSDEEDDGVYVSVLLDGVYQVCLLDTDAFQRIRDGGQELMETPMLDFYSVDTLETPGNSLTVDPHLAGKEIYVLVDGKFDGAYVAVGDVLTWNRPGTVIGYGLGYETEIQTMKIMFDFDDGTSSTRKQRVNRVGLKWWMSGGSIEVCYDPNAKDVIVEVFDMGDDIHDGFKADLPIRARHSEEPSIAVKHVGPFPMNLLSITPKFQMKGD